MDCYELFSTSKPSGHDCVWNARAWGSVGYGWKHTCENEFPSLNLTQFHLASNSKSIQSQVKVKLSFSPLYHVKQSRVWLRGELDRHFVRHDPAKSILQKKSDPIQIRLIQQILETINPNPVGMDRTMDFPKKSISSSPMYTGCTDKFSLHLHSVCTYVCIYWVKL